MIPALNEAENLRVLLPQIPSWVQEVIVVDGGSSDGTADVAAASPGVRVLNQRRTGKGDALRVGFEAAEGEIVIMLDADGSSDPRELEAFVAALQDDADVALGSRYLDGGGSEDLTLVRRLGNGVLTRAVNLLFGTRYSDLCYGYIGFWRRCLPTLAVYQPDGFEVETLLHISAARGALRVREVPSFERRRLHGTSNLSPFRDGFRILRSIVAERLAARPEPAAPLEPTAQVALGRPGASGD